MLAKEWLNNARSIMTTIEETQLEKIRKAADLMADSIELGRLGNTFGCGHATTMAEILAGRGVKFYIHPSHNVPGDETTKERLEEALAVYKERITGV